MVKAAIDSQERLKEAAISVGLLLLAYILGSRALDTGSWIEYGGTLILIIAAFKFLHRALRKNKQ